MVNVLIINTVGLAYDGITSIILSYLKALDTTGIKIYVVGTIKIEKSIREQLINNNCVIVEMPNRKKEPIKYALALAKYIKKNNINVIHAHGNSGTLAIEMIAAWIAGCKKRIAHSHNTRCEQKKADKLLRPIFYKLYTDAIACGDEAGKWLFQDRPFTILANGRDIERFKFNLETRDNVRKSYNIKDEIVIGHVGGFLEQKNHKFLIDIYREILKREPNAKCFLIGDGPLKGQIEEMSKDIHKNLVFTGAIDFVPEILQAMDGMVLPSLFEGLPLAAIEWQINGLPCILSDKITTECKLTNLVKYLSINNSNASEWADAILEVVNSNNRLKMARESEKIIKNTPFDINYSAISLREIYLA